MDYDEEDDELDGPELAERAEPGEDRVQQPSLQHLPRGRPRSQEEMARNDNRRGHKNMSTPLLPATPNMSAGISLLTDLMACTLIVPS